MDLLQTVRKEGSRGGRTEFKWEDVKGDQHRESYLGHSLMAPVGRWQKNRDLNWYAKTKEDGTTQTEAEARREELKKVKEAEEDALARALGYDVPLRPADNPNMTALGGDKGMRKMVEQNTEHEAGANSDSVKGLGYGGYDGAKDGENREVMAGTGIDHSRRKHADRSRSRDPDDRERRRHRHDHHNEDRERRHRYQRRSRSRSRSPDRERRRKRSHDRSRDYDRHDRRRDRDDTTRHNDDRRERRHEDDRHSHRDTRKIDGHERPRRRSRSPYEARDRTHRR